MQSWDAIIVGSGFGGAMVAHRLVAAGARVLMLERGDWVARGDEAWLPTSSLVLTPHYSVENGYRCDAGGYTDTVGAPSCIGGPSVFYGCVSFRFRERDFEGDPDVVADSGAAWPFRYDELEAAYGEAEGLLGVAGDDVGDPTAPRRSAPYPQPPAALAPISRRIGDAAADLGLHPFRLPLAINHGALEGRQVCVGCRTCDSFACAIEAKNDIATTMIRPLMSRGLTVWPQAIATRIEVEGGRVVALHAFRKDRDEAVRLATEKVIVCAGALGTPHLLLASGLEHPALGRYLMRHDNQMVFGFYPSRPDQERVFHKQLAIHDWYFGDPSEKGGLGKLGGVQQVMTPPRELVKLNLRRGTRSVLSAFTEQLTGLLCIAEDQPRADNRVTIDPGTKDRFGLPQLVIASRYTERDQRALQALVKRAKRVLRKSGAWFFLSHKIKTFSHALGTARMGVDAQTAPLDEHGGFRGTRGLWVADGSALPTSAGVNPSLTIAANALRIGERLCK